LKKVEPNYINFVSTNGKVDTTHLAQPFLKVDDLAQPFSKVDKVDKVG
jgi:hypothetical protein